MKHLINKLQCVAFFLLQYKIKPIFFFVLLCNKFVQIVFLNTVLVLYGGFLKKTE